MRHLLITICLLISGSAYATAATDTVSLFFPFNESNLSDEARGKLDAAIYKGIISETRSLQIIGYADEIGSSNYNLGLSRKRAESVKSYLIASGFQARYITLVIGKGEAGARPVTTRDGNLADRRVDLVPGASLLPIKQEKVVSVKFIPGRPKKLTTSDIGTMTVGETLVLENIYFVAGRHVTRPESDDALDALYKALETHPGVRVSIEGHVCCVPPTVIDAIDDDTHKMELSVNRAKAILDYLVKRGLDPNRLEFAGFGHRKPVVTPEHSEEEADQNRRVEVRVIK